MLFTADGPIDYTGQYYKLKKAYFSPPCTQKPHVPIMVGGNGEKRTLRTLVRFGDCEELGRDPSEIKRTMVIPLRIEKDEKEAVQLRKSRGDWGLYGSIPFITDRIQQYIDAGDEEIIFSGIPSKPKLFEQIVEEVISAFS